MTIHEIKHRTLETAPYFFKRETLRFFGQTVKSFSVRKMPDGKYRISAPIIVDGKKTGQTVRFFNPETNNLELPIA